MLNIEEAVLQHRDRKHGTVVCLTVDPLLFSVVSACPVRNVLVCDIALLASSALAIRLRGHSLIT